MKYEGINMVQDMANYIKKLTEENEKLKEEKEIIEKENKRLRQGWEYWRNNYYYLLQTSGEEIKEQKEKVTELLEVGESLAGSVRYWKDKYYKEVEGHRTCLALNFNDISEEEIKKFAEEMVQKLGQDEEE